jgi:hypothetical protein
MRMPLALHRASTSLGFGAFTTLLRPIAISRRSRGIHWFQESVVPDGLFRADRRSREIAAQNKGRGAVPYRIICFSASDLLEARAAVKSACRYVALLHLEKNRPRAERRQSTQIGIEQLPRQSSALPGRGDSDRQDLCFVFNEP